MAFEGLTEKLQGALRKLSSKGKLTEDNVKEGMREVRMALLEADVNYAVAKDFIKKVTARCVGTEITGTLSASQQVIKIVNEEMTQLMGGENARLTWSSGPLTVYMLCGLQGAGKTTMVNLLMKFYPLGGGEIRIDGVPLSQMTREHVHDLFGMVLQDTWLFEGSIRDNLCYGKEGITDEQLDQVTRATGLYHLIHTLPEGYDTQLSDKLNLSAGQKQLMTIARAMIENAPMLILDEATSSVDTRTEMLIQQAMDTLTKGRTSFVIAHRLSTIKNADKILVMRHGDIIESGTHEELLQKGGFYAELYNSQFDEAA
mgnify:CR=1 FL=1